MAPYGSARYGGAPYGSGKTVPPSPPAGTETPWGLLGLFIRAKSPPPPPPPPAPAAVSDGAAFFPTKDPVVVEAYLAMYMEGALSDSELMALIAQEL